MSLPAGDCGGTCGNIRGFTLIEVLMALAIFSVIAVLCYTALGVAGNGFRALSDVRDKLETAGWTGRKLRADVAYLAALPAPLQQQPALSSAASVQKAPVVIRNDDRGDNEFDQLWLRVRETGQAGISEVHYFIDEEQGHLIRESRLLWARNDVQPMRWDMGEAVSFSVEAMRDDGRWQQDWRAQGTFIWPRALRIRIRWQQESGTGREWELPLQYGVNL